MTALPELELGLVELVDQSDPAPEDGELGYTSALEGGLSGLESLAEPDEIAPGQITLMELLEASAESANEP